MAKTPVLVFVGGFLGAGKTTLIARAAAILDARGMRVAVITNDQDNGSVDAQFTAARGMQAQEIAGGCFCCRFSDLLDAADRFREYDPDVIFAEPVGSCIDLSATILQPLKAKHREAYRLAPLTVLVDPMMARQAYAGELDADREYLFRHQIAEADLLCVTKRDRYTDAPALPVPVDFWLSAESGEGVDAWLEDVLGERRVAGAKLLEVEYGRYAEAEAALGWLNLHADVELQEAASPASFVGPLFDELHRMFTDAGAAIAHLKVFDRTATGYLKATICANGDEPRPEGDLMADPTQKHELAINVRAVADPVELQGMIERALDDVKGSVTIRHLRAFRPPPPKPEQRFDRVIA
jgi:hypothetical protein